MAADLHTPHHTSVHARAGSGSGKTSLLEVVAHRNQSGHVSGDVYINERPATAELIQEFVGYVMQDDHLMPNLTVRETITYLLKLRHGGLTNSDIEKRVQGILLELELAHVADLRIGSKFKRGLSGGQRRRVTIGTQLLMDPSILMCDEPTRSDSACVCGCGLS